MTQQDTSYNGWKNYETWVVGMWLDGNYDGESTYRDVLETVQEVIHEAEATSVWTLEEARRFSVEDALKSYTENYIDQCKETLGASMATDLLGAAFDEVDWSELAEAKISETVES